ncbi:MAG TPA: hypothetical protein VGS97_19135 [Actinocrinis sp.]|uniref:hypothetical protein n=1 Tax=Actinocrinis sp. TaxID=1920516 RepID=UPI002DDDB178|nr:hypothetical protein [Actinocrinis sp.]HEV2346222.1 hypothetical protein [Actinocrinis sp.]
MLGRSVAAPIPARHCGDGSLSACCSALLGSPSQAATESAATVCPGGSTCSAGDQRCADSIIQDVLGDIAGPPVIWQNRPTYRQVVEFPSGP